MDAVGNIKIAALRFLRGDQCLDSIIEQTDPREALSTLDGREAHSVSLAQVTGFCKCLSQGSHQHGLVLYGGILPFARAINRKSSLQVAEDSDIVDDETTLFVSVDPVCPCDRLHQRMVPHRLVEVDGRTVRYIKAGHP